MILRVSATDMLFVCEGIQELNAVAALTTANRTDWAKVSSVLATVCRDTVSHMSARAPATCKNIWLCESSKTFLRHPLRRGIVGGKSRRKAG